MDRASKCAHAAVEDRVVSAIIVAQKIEFVYGRAPCVGIGGDSPDHVAIGAHSALGDATLTALLYRLMPCDLRSMASVSDGILRHAPPAFPRVVLFA